MAIDYSIKQGDRLPLIAATLRDATNRVVNLSGATVRFLMNNKSTGVSVIDSAASITDAVKGAVEYAWIVGDTDDIGVYRAEWEVTFANGKSETFPNSSYLQIKIFADLGGVAPDE